ncbi:calmodulin-like [Daktulosphaira vitifoliae]|uniref:calmodulin-like n=1 Tax=Daktulosphaira vitifoliae TaxID=58002 RepID=UPI0021A9809A|nr:calmodulin-like [Daktulosphaira vitifoliae]
MISKIWCAFYFVSCFIPILTMPSMLTEKNSPIEGYQVTEEELNILKQLFIELSDNNDTNVPVTQIISLFKMIGITLNEEEIKKIPLKCDGQNTVDFKTFVSLLYYIYFENNTDIDEEKETFTILSEGKGYISREKLKEILIGSSLYESEDQIDNDMKMFEVEDDKMNYDQYQNWIKYTEKKNLMSL